MELDYTVVPASAHLVEIAAIPMPANEVPTSLPEEPQAAERPKSAQQSIIIDRPLAAVFAFGSDLPKRGTWQRGTVAGELVDALVDALGARCTELRKGSGGTEEQWNLEIIEFEQDKSLTITRDSDAVHIVEHHQFDIDQSSARRTRYTLRMEATGSRWSNVELQRQIVDLLIHFRDCVENPSSASARAMQSRRAARIAETPAAVGSVAEGALANGR